MNYESRYRDPVLGTYKGHDIISMGPPSSGGALLINMLNMLENYPMDTLGFNSSNYIHLMTEVQRRAYADRAEHKTLIFGMFQFLCLLLKVTRKRE